MTKKGPECAADCGADGVCEGCPNDPYKKDRERFKPKIIAYRLQPVYEAPAGAIQTAAVMQCNVTGETLDGMGGGGTFISPKVAKLIQSGQLHLTQKLVDAALADKRIITDDT